MPLLYTIDRTPFKKMTKTQYKKAMNAEPVEYQGIEGLLNSIAPKDRDAIRNILTYPIMDTIVDIMYMAGIGTKNNIVVDSDSGLPLPYNNNKFMVFPHQMINNNNSNIVNFDPIFNYRMMEAVFNVYISKISMERGYDVRSFYIYNSSSHHNTKCAVVRFNDSAITVMGSEYYNDTVAYIDLMMYLEGLDHDYIRSKCEAIDKYIIDSKRMKGHRYEY